MNVAGPHQKPDAGPLPKGPYDLIYADPPWQYDDTRNKASTGAARSSYETMRLFDIENLPVDTIAAKSSALALWVTPPKLYEGYQVIRAWGFKYATVGLVWIKTTRSSPPLPSLIRTRQGNPHEDAEQALAQAGLTSGGQGDLAGFAEMLLAHLPAPLTHSGIGHYTKSNMEFCLFARRIRQKALPRVDLTVPQLIFAPVGSQHSAKPAEAYVRLERLFGDVRRVELFARYPRQGWDGWGLEYPEQGS